MKLDGEGKPTSMSYYVQIYGIDDWPSVGITQTRYLALKEAKGCLLGAFALEEKYELLLRNYLDLERECLNISSDSLVCPPINNAYWDFFRIRLELNRRVVNLLTAAKLYHDQTLSGEQLCAPNDAERIKAKVKSLFEREALDHFEFRFMKALRNHVQHRGLAVHFVEIISEPPHQGAIRESEYLEYRTCVFTNKSDVENDNEFTKSVLAEMPDKVDLIHAARIYIESLSRIHGEVRGLIGQKVEESRTLVRDTIAEYKSANKGVSVGLNAFQCDATGSIIERIPLLLDWDDVRVRLLEKNSLLSGLHKRYASSKACQKSIAH